MEKLEDLPSGRIGNNSTEAFAHMVLKNNYFAWLYDIRSRELVSDLKTEYDTKVSNDSPPAADVLLKDMEICPTTFQVMDKDHSQYKDIRKERMKTHQQAYALNKDHPSIHTMKIIDEEMNKENPGENNLTRDQKRRKLSRGLKDFTGSADKEAVRTKGWNHKAREEMTELAERIGEDVDSGMYTLFETTFRGLYNELNGKKQTDEATKEPVKPVKYNVLWEL